MLLLLGSLVDSVVVHAVLAGTLRKHVWIPVTLHNLAIFLSIALVVYFVMFWYTGSFAYGDQSGHHYSGISFVHSQEQTV